MKTFDLMILGPATRDVNIDYTGAEDRSAGGAVTFCTPAAAAAGAEVFAAVKIAPEDADILAASYAENYPRSQRLPVQIELYRLLCQAGTGTASEKRFSFFGRR